MKDTKRKIQGGPDRKEIFSALHRRGKNRRGSELVRARSSSKMPIAPNAEKTGKASSGKEENVTYKKKGCLCNRFQKVEVRGGTCETAWQVMQFRGGQFIPSAILKI